VLGFPWTPRHHVHGGYSGWGRPLRSFHEPSKQMRRRWSFLSILIVLASVGCSEPGQKTSGESSTLRGSADTQVSSFDEVFEEEVSVVLPIGEEQVIGEVATALRWNGALAIVDRIEAQVLVFSPDGSEVLARLGGPGAGPGEFRDPSDAMEAPDGSLWVLDRLRGVIEVFSETFEHAGRSDWFSSNQANQFEPAPEVLGEGVIATGRPQLEGERYSPFAVSFIPSGGAEPRALYRIPRPDSRNKSPFLNPFVEVHDEQILIATRVSDSVWVHDPRTATTSTVQVGQPIYSPPDWPERDFAGGTDLMEWAQEQMLFEDMISHGDVLLGVFATFDATTREKSYHYTVYENGRVSAATGPTAVRLIASVDGRLVAFDELLDGRARMTEFSLR